VSICTTTAQHKSKPNQITMNEQLPSGTAEQQEQAFVGVLQATEDYLSDIEQLSNALKAGWFSLARAKYAAAGGAGTLSPAACPGEMRASAVLQLIAPSDEDDLYDCFELRTMGAGAGTAEPASGTSGGLVGESPEDRSTSTAVPAAEEPDTTSSSASATQPAGAREAPTSRGISSDPLHWFGGGLPSADLRQAQRDFKSALRAAVAAANRLQQLRGAAEAVVGRGDDGRGRSGAEGQAEGKEEEEEHAGVLALLRGGVDALKI